MSRVYVTQRLPDDILAPLVELSEVGLWDAQHPVPREVLIEEVAHCDGLLCMITEQVDRDLLGAAPELRVVSQMAVGVDNVDLAECKRRGIAVGHTPEVLTETVADTAFALLGSVVRRLPEGEALVKVGEWGPWSPFQMLGSDLHGSVLGIVGLGRIGKAVARRAGGYGMEVLYSSPSKQPGDLGTRVPLPDLLERSDHVVLCAALTDATRGMIGAPELAMMKPTAFLVNVARGPLVDTASLVRALDTGSIAGAALDVTDPEPLPVDHPLLSFANCLVVPHIGSASVGTRRAMATLAVKNLVSGLRGVEMPARHPDGG